MSKRQSVLLIPDTQIPFHDPILLDKLIKVAERHQPTKVVMIGDVIDFPQVSRWSIGTAEAYSPTLQEHIDATVNDLLSPLRQAVPDAEIIWLAGNHCQRLEEYVKKYAFPLRSLRAMGMRELFTLDELNISYVDGPIRIASNTYALHGHETGGYATTMSAWDAKLTKRYGSHLSFVMGHTHQPGIIHRAFGYKGDLSPRFTMNVGSIMEPKKVTYVKDQSMSWVQSFAWLEDDGKRVFPELVTLVDRLGYFKGQRL